MLRCPRCRREGTLDGALRCSACGHRMAVEDGVVDAMVDPPEVVVLEAAGLARFAEVMRADGWDRERILNLPHEPSPYWHGQRAAFGALLVSGRFHPGDRLLDVGANSCWAAAAFAREGLEVTALDIARHELQGLDTGRWWMERDGTHFERVLGLMFDLPFATASFDHVFCCEVLHHNSPRTLLRTLREIRRVLVPGGRLSVIRETLRAPLNPQIHPGAEVADFEGNEHAYLASTYLAAARLAGLSVQVEDPADHWVLSGKPFPPGPHSPQARVKLAALDVVRRRPRLRRAYRAHLHHVTGSVPLSFTATKR